MVSNPLHSLNVVFRFDDVRSNPSELEWRVCRLFAEKNIPLSLAIIPCDSEEKAQALKDSSYLEFLKKGDFAICLHGLTHQNGDTGEFGKLDEPETQRRLSKGKQILKSVFDVDINTFVPPYNQVNKNTLHAALNNNLNLYSGSLSNLVYEDDIDYYVSSKRTLFFKSNHWDEVIDVLTQKYFFEELYVVVFHHYDLNSTEDWEKLERILDYCNANESINVYTFSKLKSNDYSVGKVGLLLNQLVYPFRLIFGRGGTICFDNNIGYLFLIIYGTVLVLFFACIKLFI